jgi:acetylornithine/succinyldiaminopimelate/putrescine aminotransferase
MRPGSRVPRITPVTDETRASLAPRFFTASGAKQWSSRSRRSRDWERAYHRELAGRLVEQQGSCGLDFAGGPGACVTGDGSDASVDGRREQATLQVEHFNLVERATRNGRLEALRNRRAAERAERRGNGAVADGSGPAANGRKAKERSR